MSLTDRLREVVRSGPGAGAACSEPDPDAAPLRTDVADALGGTWRETEAGRFLVVDRTYAAGHRHGHMAVADAVPPAADLWPALETLAGSFVVPGPRALFLDLETTGLAGGAGTYAFLVGCGWFEAGGGFHVRQWVLTSFAGERALLAGVAQRVAEADGLITYNGRTFDVPLLESRFLLHRMPAWLEVVLHLDLLHPARRLWRDDAPAAGDGPGSCRLTALERTRCGYQRRGDVPGAEIPSRYFAYVRTGDAAPLQAVLKHNRLDLLSLALLTSRAGRLVEAGPDGAVTVQEALGLGQLLARAGRAAEAHACFARAAGLDGHRLRGDAATRARALRAYARACRRARQHDEAARAWRGVLELGSPAHVVREATEALAVHHEHRLRDPRSARRLAWESLLLMDTAARRHAARRRLARLDRKFGGPRPVPEAGIQF